MTGKYLYGFVASNAPATFGVSGFPPQAEAVYTVVHCGLACVVSNYSGDDFTSLTKEQQIRCLMAHQAVIERVMNEYTILPMKFGTVVASDAEALRIIQQGYGRLADALARMDGKVEMEVAATWDLKQVLAEIGREDEIVRLKESMGNRPPAETLEEQIGAGRRVKESLDRRRDAYREGMLEFLKGAALDAQPNALVAEEMVMNVAFLIERQREEEFDNRVRELDSAFQDQIDFRIIGPLPPYSFGTVEVIRPSPAKVEEARQLLGLGAFVSRAEVKEAYRRLAAASHPDARPGDEGAHAGFARVREAFALLTAYCQGQDEGDGQVVQERRYSLAAADVSQTFLINIKRSPALVVA